MRPVDAGAEDRIVRVGGDADRALEQLPGRCEIFDVDQRVREQHREADRLGGVVLLLGRGQRLSEDRDRRLHLVDHRVGAAEAVGRPRVVGQAVLPEDARLLESGDRLPRLAGPERDLPETGEGPGSLVLRRRAIQRFHVELLRNLRLVQPERELRLDQHGSVVVALLSGREIVLADTEPPAHLA